MGIAAVACLTAAIGTVMYPAMKAGGYDNKFALGTIMSGGTLGIIIPPSIPMIIYGLSAGRGDGYSLLQVTNLFWTLTEALQISPPFSSDIVTACLIVPAMALAASTTLEFIS